MFNTVFWHRPHTDTLHLINVMMTYSWTCETLPRPLDKSPHLRLWRRTQGLNHTAALASSPFMMHRPFEPKSLLVRRSLDGSPETVCWETEELKTHSDVVRRENCNDSVFYRRFISDSVVLHLFTLFSFISHPP